jgi:phospholipid/cholesterol/gamma-HCH transport system substrate-binding protein
MSRAMSTTGAAWRFAIFAVVTVLATGLLAITIANVDTRSSKHYSAVISDAANVISGDEVRLAGVRVGTVNGVSLYQGRYAKVDFSVIDSVPLTSTTRIEVRYRNLIGQRYLAVVDGAGAGQRLAAGATIPMSRTSPALNLTTLFNGFRPLLRGLDPADVNQLSYQLVQVLQGEGGTVTSLFRQVGALTNTLADRDKLIGNVIEDLDASLGPIAEHDQELSALIGNVQSFVSGLSHDRAAIGQSLVSINHLTRATSSLLADARPALADDIQHLGVLAEKLNAPKTKELLRHFLTYTPFKLKVSTPEASYGAFLNFYVCGVNFILPDGTETPMQLNDAHRCNP